MWTIAKIKLSEIEHFKKEVIKKIGSDTLFFIPKVKIQNFQKNKLKNKEKYILEDYIFCFNRKFSDKKTFQTIKFIKGLKYFLSSCFSEQKSGCHGSNHCFWHGHRQARRSLCYPLRYS